MTQTDTSRFSRTETFLTEAAQLLGPKGLTTLADDIEPWVTDWRGRYSGRALALASPASTAELSALVKLCTTHSVPIVPQGGNSGMAGGATPDNSGAAILLSLRRLNSIRNIDKDAGQAVCDAGVILQTFHEAAEDAGMRFPLTLGGKGSATIGDSYRPMQGARKSCAMGQCAHKFWGSKRCSPMAAFSTASPCSKRTIAVSTSSNC